MVIGEIVRCFQDRRVLRVTDENGAKVELQALVHTVNSSREIDNGRLSGAAHGVGVTARAVRRSLYTESAPSLRISAGQ